MRAVASLSWPGPLRERPHHGAENVPDPVFHLPGLFWLVRLDDDAFQKRGEDGSVRVLHVDRLLEFDRFQLLGPGNVPVHLTFDTTYRITSKVPTLITPLSSDPLSAFNWSGKMWNASAKGRFSFSYDDGSFAVEGTMDSAVAGESTLGGALGHMGHERNGVFATMKGDD